MTRQQWQQARKNFSQDISSSCYGIPPQATFSQLDARLELLPPPEIETWLHDIPNADRRLGHLGRGRHAACVVRRAREQDRRH